MMYLVWGCLIQQALCRENLPTVESSHDSKRDYHHGIGIVIYTLLNNFHLICQCHVQCSFEADRHQSGYWQFGMHTND
jgi:hypothetical protein